jgi:hypothetical protein
MLDNHRLGYSLENHPFSLSQILRQARASTRSADYHEILDKHARVLATLGPVFWFTVWLFESCFLASPIVITGKIL